jgi:hypothetical protein
MAKSLYRFSGKTQTLNGIVPDKLSKDEREILESKWTLFVAEDN